VVDNRISNATIGVNFLGDGPPSSKYRDSLIANVTYPFFGGINAGGNN
jgi:hypothetical protein